MNAPRNGSRANCACLLACLLTVHAAVGATFLSRDPALAALAPPAAFENIGCWQAGEYFVATGHSTTVDSIGPEKGRRTERDFAEDDAKARMGREAAKEQDTAFDDESHTLVAAFTGFQTAATYRMEGREGLFLIGLAKKLDVRVRSIFDAVKARHNAETAFAASDYSKAARLFAKLTQHDIQDAGTTALARAASAYVNLAAGVRGAQRNAALNELRRFYQQRRDTEQELHFSYDLYRETDTPDRELLQRLAELCSQSHRVDSAVAFRNEITRRWPLPTSR